MGALCCLELTPLQTESRSLCFNLSVDVLDKFGRAASDSLLPARQC